MMQLINTRKRTSTPTLPLTCKGEMGCGEWIHGPNESKHVRLRIGSVVKGNESEVETETGGSLGLHRW